MLITVSIEKPEDALQKRNVRLKDKYYCLNVCIKRVYYRTRSFIALNVHLSTIFLMKCIYFLFRTNLYSVEFNVLQ